jgi:hypothetical protein
LSCAADWSNFQPYYWLSEGRPKAYQKVYWKEVLARNPDDRPICAIWQPIYSEDGASLTESDDGFELVTYPSNVIAINQKDASATWHSTDKRDYGRPVTWWVRSAKLDLYNDGIRFLSVAIKVSWEHKPGGVIAHWVAPLSSDQIGAIVEALNSQGNITLFATIVSDVPPSANQSFQAKIYQSGFSGAYAMRQM